MSGTVVAQIIPFLALPFISRIYTPDLTRVFTVYTSIINITTQIACLRYDYAIVVADDDDEAGGVFVLSCVLAIIFSLLMAACMWPFLPQIAGLFDISKEKESLWMIPLTTLICGTTTALNYFNVRYEKYKVIARANVIKSVAAVIIQIALYYLGCGYWGLILGQLLSNFFGNAEMFKTLKGRIHRNMMDRQFLNKVAKKNANFPKFMLASALANSLTLNLQPLAISNFYGSVNATYVQKANQLLGQPLTLISTAVSQVFLKQASVDKHNEKNLEKTFSNVAKWLAIIGVIPFAILFIFANPIIPLFLGKSWMQTAQVMKYLIPLFAVRFVVTPLTSSAIALGKQKATMIWQFCLLGTVVLPMLVDKLIIAIPFAWFLIITSGLMAIAYLIFYKFCYNIVKEAKSLNGSSDESSIDVNSAEKETPAETFAEVNSQEKGNNQMDDKKVKEKSEMKKQSKIGVRYKKISDYFKSNKPFGYTLVLLIIAVVCLAVIGGKSLNSWFNEQKYAKADATKIEFKDKNFETEIRKVINRSSGDIYDLDLEKVATLKIENVEIKQVPELKYFTSLQNLEISSSTISDISSLSNLVNLKDLDLSNNKIMDISALKNCTSLDTIDLSGNQITDISPIYGLTDVVKVNISNNSISNVSTSITQLKYLTDLNLSRNRISDNSVFSGMSQLKTLYLNSNKIVDVKPLTGMDKLEEYTMEDNAISKVTTLGDVPVLKKLNLENNNLTEINFVSKYPWLDELNINYNDVSSLEPLKDNTSLECLKMMYTKVTDVSVLKELYDSGKGKSKGKFNSIYLDPAFDRTKVLFMKDSFKFADSDTKKYFLDLKYKFN